LYTVVEPRLILVVQLLARCPLDRNIALVVIEDRQAERERRTERRDRRRVPREGGSYAQRRELLYDGLPQLLLLRLLLRATVGAPLFERYGRSDPSDNDRREQARPHRGLQ